MIRPIRPIIQTTSLCITIVFATGCATKGDIEALQNQMSELQSTMQQTSDNAANTTQLATQTTAELAELRALTKATNALAVQNSEKMERMFNKSLLK